VELPEPQTRTFSGLIAEIEKGQIKIPQFQREFVWTVQKSASLLDSIVKGYPIGTFIFWRTTDRLRSVRNIGAQKLPEPAKGEAIDYVLDGQQRLTSIYACLKGATIERAESSQTDDFSKIYIDLEAEDHDAIVVVDIAKKPVKAFISVLDLLTGDFQVLASFPEKYHDKLKAYKNRIESYQYSIIQIKNAPIDIATEIFTRINVGGKPLTLFEVMVAKTFDHDRNFDLSEKYDEVIESLENVGYETVSDATFLQVVSLFLADECKRQVILGLKKDNFINTWPDAVDAVERAIDYFRGTYRIPVSKLLPYNALIVPFAYFFYKHPDKPKGETSKRLADFFWRCALSGRYSSGVEGKLAQDIKRIDTIIEGKLPAYDWAIDTSDNFVIENGWFSAGRSYIKAILCIYAYQQPKSFNDNALVNISNNWLKQANSKNYHHFFPKSYLKKKGEERGYINHVLNITIVDDFLNKREIRAKAPATYMKKFAKENEELVSTMKTHLIHDLEKFGVWENDYDVFFDKRAAAISKELRKRIIEQSIDSQPQPDLVDDYEEEPSAVE
jgi:hypothetical protein